MTKARDLGNMAVSMLKGLDGNQHKEIKKLCGGLADLQAIEGEKAIDAIHLSNCLLTGLAAPLKARFQTKIACTLMGELGWIEALPEPQRSQVWDSIAKNAQSVDIFFAVSQDYANRMQPRLKLPDEKIKVIHNGIDLTGFDALPDKNVSVDNDKQALTLGFFSRLIPSKGLHTLVDAFIKLHQMHDMNHVTLKIGGAKTKAEEKYLAQQAAKLRDAGLTDQCSFHFNVSRETKLNFLVHWTYSAFLYSMKNLLALMPWRPGLQVSLHFYPEQARFQN